MTKDELIQEALDNARRDRKNVESVRDHILKLTQDPSVNADGASVLGIADNIAKLSDVLTKMNAQIVELTKIAAKAERVEDGKDNESLFDEIESGQEVEEKN